MSKGLLKLNDDALYWLGNHAEKGGRIGTIDIQIGCPWQCVVCGVDAPIKSKNMRYNDVKTILDSILEVKIRKGIEVLSKDEVSLSHASDPTNYLSWDGNKRITLYHPVTELTKTHNKKVVITTSGWKPGNNALQQAMEQIVSDNSNNNPKVEIMYSIKTVTEEVIREYDSFLKQNHEPNTNSQALNLKFIRSSKYFSKMIDNIFTLIPLRNLQYSKHSVQYFSHQDIKSLNPEYTKYDKLFSQEFLEQVKQHIQDEWYYATPLDKNNRPYSEPSFTQRCFTGTGRALQIGKMDTSSGLARYMQELNSSSNENIDDLLYFAEINTLGKIQIYYGEQHNLGRVLVSKDQFIRQAEQEKINEKKNEYLMLAELQGTNLLN